MPRSFQLPDLGEGIHEGEVLAVLVSVGDAVTEGDPILEVETDKAAVEIPSPFTGTVEEILVKPGDLINVGDPLMTFSDEGDTGRIPAKKTADRRAAPDVPQPPPGEKREPVPASPATRRMAREMGVDLFDVRPTGPGGLVTADDVRLYAESRQVPAESTDVSATRAPVESQPVTPLPAIASPPPLPDFEKWGPVERIPLRSVRRATARQMALAWSQIPHVANQDWADITRLESFRQNHKAGIQAKGGALTLTVFALKAAVSALKQFPIFNASLDTQSGQIHLKKYYHIGVAVDTPDGLFVPVIRDVDRKSITELAIELKQLIRRTHDRVTTLEEMQGGTFTITNAGSMGGGHFAPIINYPEAAILGMGKARMQPVVDKTSGDIVPRLMMPIVLSFDHRVADGVAAIRFMRRIIDVMEDPDDLLLTMV